MGTSINQGSPNTTSWAVVAACYDNDVPIDETVIEIWRAATIQNPVFVDQLKSDAIAVLVQQPVAPSEIDAVFARSFEKKQHSIAGELAMRAVLVQAGSGKTRESPLAVFFRQMTEYFVARDISGHVGPAHRCKTFAEVTLLKSKLSDAVAGTVQAVEIQYHLSSKPWSEALPIVLKSLTR